MKKKWKGKLMNDFIMINLVLLIIPFPLTAITTINFKNRNDNNQYDRNIDSGYRLETSN